MKFGAIYPHQEIGSVLSVFLRWYGGSAGNG